MHFRRIDFGHYFILRIRNRPLKTAVRIQTVFVILSFLVTVFCPAPADSANGSIGSVSVQSPIDNPGQNHFSRSSPVVQTNLLFSAYYEAPAPSWKETCPRGHVTATRIYDPVNPGLTDRVELWDAGEVLNKIDPADRTIYFPYTIVTRMKDITIGTGNGSTRTFSGRLYAPIVAASVRISDQLEVFRDEHIKELTGDFGGKGTINRFSGVFEVTFDKPPGYGIPIKCSYAYYTSDSTLKTFNTNSVSNNHLGLDDPYDLSDGYKYDLNGDGSIDESDGDYLVQWIKGFSDGASTRKQWLLGAVDQSVPAVATPPGRPHWYYGTSVAENERLAFDSFLLTNSKRRTVVYVGAKDGMLHAFDAGQFRWGDNRETAVVETQGYFEWKDRNGDPALNQQWNRLLAFYPSSPPEFRWQDFENGGKAPDYGCGEELWAFIPPNLMARLKNNLLEAGTQAHVDASPAIADVDINGQWRTVLLCAEGVGGDAIFCLDITDPESPLFLWEFADPDLFRSRSSSAVVRIGRTALGGVKRWVAFSCSGDNPDMALEPSLFMIDIADGSLLRRVFLHAGMDRNNDKVDDNSGGVPCAEPAIIDSDGNGYVDRVYMGTDKGFMFKVNIPDDIVMPQHTIDQCLINTEFSYEDSLGVLHALPADQQFHPIYASPLVVVDSSENSGCNIRVLFGTSDNPYADDGINTADTAYHFFSYVDHNNKGACDAGSISLEWYRELPRGHRIFASAFAAVGTVYFGTATSETAGHDTKNNDGRIFALDLLDGKVIHEQAIGNIASSPLVEDEHLYIKTNTTGGKDPVIMGGGGFNNDVVKTPNAPAGIQAWREIW